jgi:tetratricopeptide (TPR) repeat protein
MRFCEAQQYCEAAIEINSQQFNAYKNLAISLQGQGEYEDAAKLFVLAVRFNPMDRRSLGLLEELLTDRQYLFSSVPGLSEALEKCRQLSTVVQ